MDTKETIIGAFHSTMQTMVDLHNEPRTKQTDTQYLLAVGGAMAIWTLFNLVDPKDPLLRQAAMLLNDAQEDLVIAGMLPNTVQMFE